MIESFVTGFWFAGSVIAFCAGMAAPVMVLGVVFFLLRHPREME